MSVAQMKAELRRLTAEERREIARALAELDEPKTRLVQPGDPDVAAAMDRVFTEYHDLLRRLAQ